jgi:hypothetical protein
MLMGSVVLEVALGLVFFYLLLSLLCTSLNELIAGFFSLRGKNLVDGLHNLLGGGMSARLYDHALVKGLSRPNSLPSYIPSDTFARTLLDIVAPAQPTGPITVQDVRAKVAVLDNQRLKQVLLILLDESGDDMRNLREGIEQWFNHSMDRASGWYKRKTQSITLLVALLLAIAVNADTIMIMNTLSQDSAVRATIVSQAEAFARASAAPQTPTPLESRKGTQPAVDPKLLKSPTAPSPTPNSPTGSKSVLGGEPHPATGQGGTPGASASEATVTNSTDNAIRQYQDLQNLGLPLGWTVKSGGDPRNVPRDAQGWIFKIIGLLVTVFAISLGAPFWFDLLNKIVSIRASGRSPREAK